MSLLIATLIVWGDKDEIFPSAGAHPYKKDLKNVEFHLLDTGHFVLEEDANQVANYIKAFLDKNVNANPLANNAKVFLDNNMNRK